MNDDLVDLIWPGALALVTAAAIAAVVFLDLVF